MSEICYTGKPLFTLKFNIVSELVQKQSVSYFYFTIYKYISIAHHKNDENKGAVQELITQTLTLIFCERLLTLYLAAVSFERK